MNLNPGDKMIYTGASGSDVPVEIRFVLRNEVCIRRCDGQTFQRYGGDTMLLPVNPNTLKPSEA